MSFYGSTDAWSENDSGTFEEYNRIIVQDVTPVTIRSSTYYFQDKPYGSLSAFNAAKAAADRPDQVGYVPPGEGYGNMGGGDIADTGYTPPMVPTAPVRAISNFAGGDNKMLLYAGVAAFILLR